MLASVAMLIITINHQSYTSREDNDSMARSAEHSGMRGSVRCVWSITAVDEGRFVSTSQEGARMMGN